jgi:hypothetical protein
MEIKMMMMMQQFKRKVMKLTLIIIEEYHCSQIHAKCYETFFAQG